MKAKLVKESLYELEQSTVDSAISKYRKIGKERKADTLFKLSKEAGYDHINFDFLNKNLLEKPLGYDNNDNPLFIKNIYIDLNNPYNSNSEHPDHRHYKDIEEIKNSNLSQALIFLYEDRDFRIDFKNNEDEIVIVKYGSTIDYNNNKFSDNINEENVSIKISYLNRIGARFILKLIKILNPHYTNFKSFTDLPFDIE